MRGTGHNIQRRATRLTDCAPDLDPGGVVLPANGAAVNIQEALATLTFTVDLDDDEMVSDAVIIARVTRMGDGRGTVSVALSEGSDIVTSTGLLHCGLEIHAANPWERAD